jgi:NAD-dependent deacetylase
MPEDAMRRATELAQKLRPFIAIGSSLVVWPAAGFPMVAKNCGRLVIINNEPTEQDDIADLVIRHDMGETLGPFVQLMPN